MLELQVCTIEKYFVIRVQEGQEVKMMV